MGQYRCVCDLILQKYPQQRYRHDMGKLLLSHLGLVSICGHDIWSPNRKDLWIQVDLSGLYGDLPDFHFCQYLFTQLHYIPMSLWNYPFNSNGDCLLTPYLLWSVCLPTYTRKDYWIYCIWIWILFFLAIDICELLCQP